MPCADSVLLGVIDTGVSSKNAYKMRGITDSEPAFDLALGRRARLVKFMTLNKIADIVVILLQNNVMQLRKPELEFCAD